MSDIEKMLETAPVVTEAEREAAEAAILERLGPDARRKVGSRGNSPYSPATALMVAAAAVERGARVALAVVCRSHDGAENKTHPGRGRWRTVCALAPRADGQWAVCRASDRDAQQIGSADFFIRPWASHEAEEASRGLGLAADAMSAAFAALGL